MAEYIVRTDKPIRLDEVLHLHGIHHYAVQKLPPHGDLIERSSVYKVLDDRVAFYKEVGDVYNACNIVCIEGDIATIPTVLEASK